jgi:hypothetical protein
MEFIQKLNNLLSKSNQLTNKKVNTLSTDDIKNIFILTDFVNAELSLYIRIKILINNIKEHPICEICKTNYVAIAKRRKIFLETCKNKECILSNKINKMQESLLLKYGSKTAFSNKDIQNKSNITRKNKYGNANNFLNNNFKIKSKEKKLIKYNDENYNNFVKNKITKFKTYGDENYNNSNKRKITIFERYGVEHQMHNIEIFNKQQLKLYHSQKYNDDIYFRSTYEKYFLDLMKKNNLINNVKNCFSIKYIFENKQKIYYPDFLLEFNNNKYIIEIKSL